MRTNKLYYFKHTWTGRIVQIELNQNTNINQLKQIINDIVIKDLKIINNYEIIIAGQYLQELAEPINLNSSDKLDSLGNVSFYIRPSHVSDDTLLFIKNSKFYKNPYRSNRFIKLINMENLSCGICYQNYSLDDFIPWTNCSHYNVCCISCINIWMSKCLENNIIPTCPICRIQM
jgi:hypothetical protein